MNKTSFEDNRDLITFVGVLPSPSSSELAAYSSSSPDFNLIVTTPFFIPKISSVKPSYVSCVQKGVIVSTSLSSKTIASTKLSPASSPGSIISTSPSTIASLLNLNIISDTSFANRPLPLTSGTKPMISR